jgi:hypothetical protein
LIGYISHTPLYSKTGTGKTYLKYRLADVQAQPTLASASPAVQVFKLVKPAWEIQPRYELPVRQEPIDSREAREAGRVTDGAAVRSVIVAAAKEAAAVVAAAAES